MFRIRIYSPMPFPNTGDEVFPFVVDMSHWVMSQIVLTVKNSLVLLVALVVALMAWPKLVQLWSADPLTTALGISLVALLFAMGLRLLRDLDHSQVKIAFRRLVKFANHERSIILRIYLKVWSQYGELMEQSLVVGTIAVLLGTTCIMGIAYANAAVIVPSDLLLLGAGLVITLMMFARLVICTYRVNKAKWFSPGAMFASILQGTVMFAFGAWTLIMYGKGIVMHDYRFTVGWATPLQWIISIAMVLMQTLAVACLLVCIAAGVYLLWSDTDRLLRRYAIRFKQYHSAVATANRLSAGMRNWRSLLAQIRR